MSAGLKEFSNELANATEKAAGHTIAVHTGPRGSSSGIIWRNGVIVTAEHALRSDEEIRVTLPDGREVSATLAGRDAASDVAVLKCAETTTAVSDWGPTEEMRAGSLVIVVGRTRVSGPVAALGVVSLSAKERRSWGGTTLQPYVRLDVGLQRTAIGGAVVDSGGKVVGMATPRFAGFGALVLPASIVNPIVDALLKTGSVPRGYLGVGLQPVRLPESLRETFSLNQRTGVIALEVAPAGPAGKAGVLVGDIFVAIDGNPVHHLGDIHSHLGSSVVGKKIQAKLIRGGELREVVIEVGQRPGAN
jgi:S1-C subfamily serine protease